LARTRNEKAVTLTMYFGDPGNYQTIDTHPLVETGSLDSRAPKSAPRDVESGAEQTSR